MQLKRRECPNAYPLEQTLMTFKFVLAQVPESNRPRVAVRTNLADGILIKAY